MEIVAKVGKHFRQVNGEYRPFTRATEVYRLSPRRCAKIVKAREIIAARGPRTWAAFDLSPTAELQCYGSGAVQIADTKLTGSIYELSPAEIGRIETQGRLFLDRWGESAAGQWFEPIYSFNPIDVPVLRMEVSA